MSVENGERLIRLLQENPELRRQIRSEGEAAFLELTAAAQASCTPYEVVSALIRQMEQDA